ncbi:MAG: hypothetical protein ACYDH6_18315 [Acidimicrobiales bacterium]
MPTLVGFAVILTCLLLATQVTFDLYARSAVTAAAVDAARAVARGASPSMSEQRARDALGAYGRATRFRWSAEDGKVVSLTVSFDLGRSSYALVSLPFLNRFARTVRVRTERVVCPSARRCTAR